MIRDPGPRHLASADEGRGSMDVGSRMTKGRAPRRLVPATLVAGIVAVAAVLGLAPRPTGALHAPPPPAAARPLQPLIDATPSGGSLRLEAGVYAGPAVIAKPMVLRGRPGAIVDGGGVGTVLAVEADGVTVAGLTLRNSGDRNDGIDAGLRITGGNGVFEDLVVEDCLYGIQLQQADGNRVRRNRISSKDLPEARRGDAIRVWYSTRNLFEANEITRVRDGFGIQAIDNHLRGNRVTDSRYGVLMLYGNGTRIEANRFDGNAVGVMAIASDDLVIDHNSIRSGSLFAGQGLLFKDSSRARVEGNDLFANATGIYIDASPVEAEERNLFRGNRISFSGTSVMLHSDLAGNVFEANAFVGNHAEVVVRGGGTALRNAWRGNHWDAFEGFDRDGDGVGDTPFEVWSWTDRLWMDVPDAQLFRATPSLAIVDFAERLSLSREPRLLLADPAPRTTPPTP